MNSDKIIRWGVIGTGKIARQFAQELVGAKQGELNGVASRSSSNAKAFAAEFPNCKAYDTNESICRSPDIDVVYVATPTQCHREHCEFALNNGKHVLCEKPFTRNSNELQQIIKLAAEQNRFCMEAMWMRFNPVIQKAKKWIDEDPIGDPVSINIQVGYQKPESENCHPNEGRGAMLAFGCYGLSLALMLLGKPKSAQSSVVRNQHGSDQTVCCVLDYENSLVSLTASTASELSNEVRINGTTGSILIQSPFIDATSIYCTNIPRQRSLLQKIGNRIAGPHVPRMDECQSGIGFQNEAIEVMRCLQTNQTESEMMPLSDSLEVHRLIEQILAK